MPTMYCRALWEKLCSDKLTCITPSPPTLPNRNLSRWNFCGKQTPVCSNCFLDMIHRWDHPWDHCKIEEGFNSDHQKWAHILATLWLYYFQVYPCSFTGNIKFPTYSSYLSSKLVWQQFWSEVFFPASGEQFLFISLDHLHNIHGQLKESRCGGGHELIVIAPNDFHATKLSVSYFCMAVFIDITWNYDAIAANTATSSFKLSTFER